MNINEYKRNYFAGSKNIHLEILIFNIFLKPLNHVDTKTNFIGIFVVFLIVQIYRQYDREKNWF